MGLGERPKHVNFTNIMYQSEQSPLYIHFGFGPQREAVHPLLHTDVGKDRLDNAQSSGIDALSLLGVHFCFHLINWIRLLGIHLGGKIPA